MDSLSKRNTGGYWPSLFESFLGRDLSDIGKGMSGNVPSVNVRENSKAFIVELAAPGLNKKDFNIEVNNNVLTISSEKEETKEDKGEKGEYVKREFSYTSFQRSFSLPENVNAEKIKATYKDGLLEIEVPKTGEPSAKSKKIDIN